MDLRLDIFKKNNNDERKIEDLFNKYYEPLCLYGYSISPINKSIIEDCVQDAFIELWKNKKKINNPKAFLYSCLKNKIISEHRHSKVVLEYFNYKHIIDKEQQYTLSQEDKIVESEINLLIVKSLDILPDKCKEIFKLFIKGMSYKDIAEKLDISVNTVKTQRARAIKIIKEEAPDLLLLFYLFSKKHKLFSPI